MFEHPSEDQTNATDNKENSPANIANKDGSLWKSVQKNGVNLGGIAMVLAATLALAYILASDRIAENKRIAQIQALSEVMPSTYFDEDILTNTLLMPAPEQLNQMTGGIIYVARKAGKTNGWIIPVTSTAGYSGTINLLVGVDSKGNVTGVRVTQHQETPGLGDKIDYKKSPWMDSFINANLTNKIWSVKKDGGDFDQFTGATITPRAVVASVADVLGYYQHYLQGQYE